MGLRCLGPGVTTSRDPFTITYRETATFPLSRGRAYYGSYQRLAPASIAGTTGALRPGAATFHQSAQARETIAIPVLRGLHKPHDDDAALILAPCNY